MSAVTELDTTALPYDPADDGYGCGEGTDLRDDMPFATLDLDEATAATVAADRVRVMGSEAEPEDEDPTVLSFPSGIPGFPEAHRFVLTQWGGMDSPFSLLRCLDQELELVVMVPAGFFPEYAPEIDDETVAQLGLTGPDDAVLLVIVTVKDSVEQSTVNLLGPIVVNRHSRSAVQAVLTEAWNTRHPLVAAS